MPERWERELTKLREVDVRERVVRERVDRGPRPDLPPRRDRAIAGIVAGVVAIAALAFLWRTFPDTTDPVGEGAAELPVLSVSFHDSEVIPEGPDSSYRRVQTAISYGDASEESFTSTISPNAHVDRVSADDLTRFVPGPTVGSAIEFQVDGDDPRVLIGQLGEWPNFDRFTEIDRLPDESGRYVLVFEATYPEGIARTARVVDLHGPGVLQLVLTEGADEDATAASAYVDGEIAEGALSTRTYISSDVGFQTEPRAPEFTSDAWLRVAIGSRMALATSATEATGGFFERYEAFDPDEPLPIDLFEGARIEGPPEQRLLAVDVTWRHGRTGYGQDGTEERALFFFRVEVVDQAPVEEMPSPESTPSTTVAPTDLVSVDIRRSDAPTSEDPRAGARFGEQEIRMCPNGWSLVGPDGERNKVLFDCGQEVEFTAVAGAPVTVTGDFETIDVTAVGQEDRTHYAPNEVPGLDPGSIVTLTFDVEWADGSEASFWLLLTVAEGPPTEDSSVLEVRCGPDGAEILTPMVVAQPDGVHVEVDNVARAAVIEFTTAGSSPARFGGEFTDGVRAWPIAPGYFFVECLHDSTETYEPTARFEVVDPNGFWVPGTLGCSEGDPVLDIEAHEAAQADYPDDEITIRALLHSVQPDDDVRLPGYPEGPGVKDGRYVVVRDGRVVAIVYVGLTPETTDGGSRFPQVTGEACANSGIAQGSIG